MATQLLFEEELEKLINKFSIEAESNTPDFILAQYMQTCLNNFNIAVLQRDKWYKFKPFDNYPESAKTIKLSSARKH